MPVKRRKKKNHPPTRICICRYAAKYLCGTILGPPEAALLAPGEYRTDVQVFNPNEFPITIRKKVVCSPAERLGETGYPSEPHIMCLEPCASFQMDCKDIAIVRGHRLDFDKGFVVLDADGELDVFTVITIKEESIGVGKKPGPWELATFEVKGEPIEGQTWTNDTRLATLFEIPWHASKGFEIIDTVALIRQRLEKDLVDAGVAASVARRKAKRLQISYCPGDNPPVFLGGSVAICCERVPCREQHVMHFP